MVVLGISPNHDSSLCLVVDGKIVSAISRERLSRVKKDRYITQPMMDYVLGEAGLTINDVDYVGISYWFENRSEWKNDFEDIKMYVEDKSIFSDSFNLSLEGDIKDKFVPNKGFQVTEDLVLLSPPTTKRPVENVKINLDIYGVTIPGWFINHHHAHAASTYYTTNHDKAAIFTLDSTSLELFKLCCLFCESRNL